jgi:hypothetical protein
MSKQKKKDGNLFETTDVQLEITNEPDVSIVENSIVSANSKTIKSKTKDFFSLEKPIFLEIHKGNLLQYISAGVIFPSKHSNQKAFGDTQTSIHSALIVSNGQIILNNDDIVLVQLDKSALDESLISKKVSFALYDGVIPISRIFKIFVSSKAVEDYLIDTIISDSGFLPNDMISIGIPKGLSNIKPEENVVDSKEWSEKLKVFDKILGLIAGTRNYSLLTMNQSDSFKSISDHTLYSIQSLDKSFAKEIISNRITEFYELLFTQTCPESRVLLNWIFKRINNDVSFTDKDTVDFKALCHSAQVFQGEEKQIKQIFDLLGSSIDRKKVFKEILNIQSKQGLDLYIFAYLRIYGTYQSPEIARNELVIYGTDKYREYAFAILNFFFGYRRLRNTEDRITITNSQISESFKKLIRPNIKLELETEFDYKVIDCIFNHVFGSKIKLSENKYNHYSNIKTQKINSDIKISGYKYSEKQIYGKVYQELNKINPLDDLLPMINKLPNNISIFSEFGLFCYRMGLQMSPFSFSDLIYNNLSMKQVFSFSKNDLIEKVKKSEIDIEELKQRISLSIKYKEIQ